MTVPLESPIVFYTGNGVITQFNWSWKMIEDSAIGVIVDFSLSDDWSWEGQSVVFGTAPASGSIIIIYRRTKAWMPEDYTAFGRFQPDKTELSMDREMMICQELNGTVEGLTHDGIVGAANIYAVLQEFYIDLISERGKDTVIPMCTPDETVNPQPDTDPAIVWGGGDIESNSFGVNPLASIAFRMTGTQGDPNQASARYSINNSYQYVGWLQLDLEPEPFPEPTDYWMRVREIDTPNPNIRIKQGSASYEFGEAFRMNAPNIYIQETGTGVQTASVRIDICDDVNGLPSKAWVSRNVTLEARYSE